MASREEQVESRLFALLVHGVNSGGEWQKDVVRILSPHFRCDRILYNHYRWFKGTELFSEPLVNASVLIGGLIWGWNPPVVVGGIGLSYLTRSIRLNRALAEVRLKISRRNVPGTRPHVIAHSLGTYLVCRILETYPDITLGHVVFTGSVVDKYFNWRRLIDRDPSGVLSVRNEVGQIDGVVALAQNREWVARGLGTAGKDGFHPSLGLVHTCSGLWETCTQCMDGDRAPVHNKVQPQGTHSNWDKGLHAFRFWLPALLGIEPREFEKFLSLCQAAAKARHDRHLSKLRAAENALRGEWKWIDGRLDKHIEEIVKLSPSHATTNISRVVDAVVTELWQFVSTAISESEKLIVGEPPMDPDTLSLEERNALRAIDPNYALTRAFQTILPTSAP